MKGESMRYNKDYQTDTWNKIFIHRENDVLTRIIASNYGQTMTATMLGKPKTVEQAENIIRKRGKTYGLDN